MNLVTIPAKIVSKNVKIDSDNDMIHYVFDKILIYHLIQLNIVSY